MGGALQLGHYHLCGNLSTGFYLLPARWPEEICRSSELGEAGMKLLRGWKELQLVFFPVIFHWLHVHFCLQAPCGTQMDFHKIMLEFEGGPARDFLLDVVLVTFLQYFAEHDPQVVGLYCFKEPFAPELHLQKPVGYTACHGRDWEALPTACDNRIVVCILVNNRAVP